MDDKSILNVAARIGSPLALAGLTICVLYLLFRAVLQLPIFPELAEGNAFILLKSIVDYVFMLGLLSLVLGISAYIYGKRKVGEKKRRVSQHHSGSGDNVAGDKVIVKTEGDGIAEPGDRPPDQ